MKLVYRDRVQELPGSDKVVRCARRRCAALQPRVAGQDREVSGWSVEGNHLHARRIGIHLCLIERPYSRILERRSRRISKHVGRHVEPVRPNSELRIIPQASADGDGEKIPSATHRIARLRDREALKRSRGIDDVIRAIELKSEIADDPAVLKCVIEDYRVAVIVGCRRDCRNCPDSSRC